MFKYRKLRCKVQRVVWKIVCAFTISLQLGATIVIKPRPQTVNFEQPRLSNDAVYFQPETIRTPSFQEFSSGATNAVLSNIVSQQVQPLSRAVKLDNRRPGSESIPTEMFQPVQTSTETSLKVFGTQDVVEHRTATALSPYNTQARFEPNHFNPYANGARQPTHTGDFTSASLIPEIITNCGGSYVVNAPEAVRAPTVVHEYHVYSSVPRNGR